MLKRFVIPKLNDLDENAEILFQQDGATAHTAKRSMDLLGEMFGSRLISLLADAKYSGGSPDLPPCDYFW